MGLGIPGIDVGINNPLGANAGAPFFITGEPLREYYFHFRLVPRPIKPGLDTIDSSFTQLFSDLYLTYISALAEKVTMSEDKFSLEQVQLGTLQLPFPKGFEVNTFSVQYLEDELNSVKRYHRHWMFMITEPAIGASYFTTAYGHSGGDANKFYDSVGNTQGMVFKELGKVCCSAMYSPVQRIPLDIPVSVVSDVVRRNIPSAMDIPVGVSIYPYVFPVGISQDPGNRSGQNIIKTTVTYARVPYVNGASGSYRYWFERGVPDRSYVRS